MKISTKKLKDGTTLSIPSDSKMHKRYHKLERIEDYFQYKYIRYDIKKNRVGKGVIVDIGANIGLHSLLYSKKLGNDLILVEAIPEFAKIAKSNLEQNGVDNFRVFNYALSTRKQELIFNIPYENYGETSSEVNDKPGFQKKVKATTIRELDKVIGKKPVAFVKVDIEGGEKPIFNDLFNWLKEKGNPSVRIELFGSFYDQKNWRKKQKEARLFRKKMYNSGYRLQKRIWNDFFLVKGKKNKFGIFLSDSRFWLHDFFAWNFKNRFIKN